MQMYHVSRCNSKDQFRFRGIHSPQQLGFQQHWRLLPQALRESFLKRSSFPPFIYHHLNIDFTKSSPKRQEPSFAHEEMLLSNHARISSHLEALQTR